MDYFLFATISAFSIVVPTSIVLYRSKQIPGRYLPFMLLLCIGFLNEVLSYSLIINKITNLVNSNIYTLFEYLLYMNLFYRIGTITKKWIPIYFFLGIAIWVTDNLLIHKLTQSNSLFKIGLSLIIIWLSINKLTGLCLNGAADRFKKTDLLLCFSLLAYFTFSSFVHLFNQFAPEQSPEFYIQLWMILALLNILVNITFSIAILWIPKQQELFTY